MAKTFQTLKASSLRGFISASAFVFLSLHYPLIQQNVIIILISATISPFPKVLYFLFEKRDYHPFICGISGIFPPFLNLLFGVVLRVQKLARRQYILSFLQFSTESVNFIFRSRLFLSFHSLPHCSTTDPPFSSFTLPKSFALTSNAILGKHFL